jgi:hypothetical protein
MAVGEMQRIVWAQIALPHSQQDEPAEFWGMR